MKINSKEVLLLLTMISVSFVQAVNECTPGRCRNCKDFSGDKYCTECSIGLFEQVGSSSEQGKCIWPEPKIEYCLKYTSKTECYTCQDGYYPGVGGTKCEKHDSSSKMANCLVSRKNTGTMQCDQCAEGYAITSNGCKTVSRTIDNCRYYAEVVAVGCFGCKEGYHLSEDTSQICVENTTDNHKGCWKISSNVCTNCDVNHRYYAVNVKSDGNQVCVKSSSSSSMFFIQPLIFLIAIAQFLF